MSEQEQEREPEQELLVDVVRIIVELRTEVAALHELVIALAVAGSLSSGASLSDTATVMEFIRILTGLRKGQPVAESMKYVARSLDALSGVHPLIALLSSALMHQQAGDHRRQALHTWLTQASPAEIEQDLQHVLRRFVSENTPPEGDGESRDV